jgi:hypothetical protein
MAVNRVYSVDEVIDEVYRDSSSKEEENEPILQLGDVIRTAVEQFHPLRRHLDDYSRFCEEASTCLQSLYQRHEIENHNRTEKVLASSTNIRPIINSETQIWLKNIKRRMRANPTARNPWTVQFTRDLPEIIFHSIKRAIAGGASSFGVFASNECIKFTEKKRLVRDLAKLAALAKKEVEDVHLKKSFKVKKFSAEVEVSSEKTFEVWYDFKKMKVTVACKYKCINEFGYCFS